jgi:hypothetical protein
MDFLLVGSGLRHVTEELMIGTGIDLYSRVPNSPICCRKSRDDWEITGYVFARIGCEGIANFAAGATYTFVATPAGVTLQLSWKSKPNLASYFGGATECISFWQPYMNRVDTTPSVQIYDARSTTYSCDAVGQKDAYTGYPHTIANKITILPVSGPHASLAACQSVCGNPLP